MAVFGSIGSFLKSRQMLALLAVVAGVAALGYGASTLAGASEMPPSEASLQPNTGLERSLAQSSEIAVKGRLVFPRQQHLTFETPGEVGEVLVQEGHRVTAGQVLARLDRTSLIEMEEAIAQAKLDRLRIRETQDRVQKKFNISPLEGAQFDDAVAHARKGLKDALELLEDFHRDHQRKIADATKAKADAEFALLGTMYTATQGQLAPKRSSLEALADFQADYQWQLSESGRKKTDAEAALDGAEDALAGFDIDYRGQLAKVRRLKAQAEIVVDKAEEALASFYIDYQKEIDSARIRVGRAEEASIEADNSLTAFIVPLGLTQSLHDIRIEDGADPEEILDSPLDDMQRLRTRVEEARTSLGQAKRDLAYLEGNRSLKLRERQTVVAEAKAALAQAEKDSADLVENRSLRLQERQSVVEEARAALAQAEDDLADLEKEPDSFLLRSLQAAVEADRAALTQAEIDLTRLLEGPDAEDLAVLQQGVANWRAALQDLFEVDSLEVDVLEARDSTVGARLEDLMNDLEGAVLRAPFAGIVSLVNVEVDDRVTDESRVMILVDPTVVEVAGIVDASQVRLVQPGAEARITIASVPGQQLKGSITSVAGEPRTERGVVNYAVAVQVNLPPGVEVPLGPTAVSVLVNAVTVN